MRSKPNVSMVWSDVGFELLARPVLVIGLGRDARNLAVDIRHRGQLLQVLPPRIENARLDAGLADVVEDEADFRTLPDHLDHIRHLMMKDADVEGDVMGRQQFQAFDELRPDAKIRIGLGLDQAPDGAQELVLAQFFEVRLDGAGLFRGAAPPPCR